MERFCFNGVKPLLRNLGKSHMIVIEHEDSIDGVANLVAALHGARVGGRAPARRAAAPLRSNT